MLDAKRFRLVAGAGAGMVGGWAFGGAMALIGFLPSVAAIVRTDSLALGFAVHLVFAAVIGAGFGLLVARQRAQSREMLFWGLAYGTLWWFLGPLTLLPVLLGDPVRWDVPTAQTLLPSLIGHLVYGAITAAAFALFTQGRDRRRTRPATLVRGLAAGAITGTGLATSIHLMMDTAIYELVISGSVMGLLFPLLFGDGREGTGPKLIRGLAFGFAWWVLVRLTVPPLITGHGLDWALSDVRASIPTLPGYLLLGAGTAALFGWLGSLSRKVFSDDVREAQPARFTGGRAISVLHGVLAGLAGGLVFTGVMVAVGFLPTVAALIGSESVAVGLILHLLISQAIGVSYAIFFRRGGFDPASALGWGVSYGFLWWILGNLTLLPLLLGSAPTWTAQALAVSFPSLVGHLAYGAVLGLVCQRLAERVNPPHLTRSQAAAERAEAAREQLLGAAPAMWTVVTVLALLIPVLVA